MTGRIAAWTSRRPLRTTLVWALALLVAVALVSAFLGDALTSEEHLTNDSESERAHALHFDPARDPSEVVVVSSRRQRIDDASFHRRVESLAAQLRNAGATRVISFYETGEPSLVSADRHAMRLPVAVGTDPEERIEHVVAAVERADGGPFDVKITGEWTLDADFSTLADEDLRRGELAFGLPAALIVLLVVFGSVVAAVVPLVLALAAIVVALALAALVGQAFPLSDFVVNMIAVMGLALGIDYCLFVLSRYREERGKGSDELAAIRVAGATAGRTVVFSGTAFTLAMLGLLLVPDAMMRSLAAGAILVGLVSVLAAITLVPALLGWLGDRVDALRIPRLRPLQRGGRTGFWSAAVGRVMRRPVLSILLVGGALLAAAAPVPGLNSGEAGIDSIPDRMPAKQGFVALGQEFPDETAHPVEVVIDGPVDPEALRRAGRRLAVLLRGEESLGRPSLETDPGSDVVVLSLPIAGDPYGQEAIDTVRELQGRHLPQAFAGTGIQPLVGGTTAEQLDETDAFSHWLPIVLAFVLALSFALLMAAFRSIVVAAKAVVLNLLSVGAAYGLVVLVFQHGVGNELLGFERIDAVPGWLPLFLFAVLFGLSMDYHVFLLSRIRERFARTGDNSQSIASGVTSTGRIITGAALIIIAVFTGFARGELVMFQQLGFGVAAALLLDATDRKSVV